LVARAAVGISDHDEAERARSTVRQRARSILDSWRNVVSQAKKDAAQRAYSHLDPGGKGFKPLLRTVLDEKENVGHDERKFEAPMSMRDVEAGVHLWIQRQPLGGYRAPKAAVAEPETQQAAEVADGE
jgi:hypothetical protein